MALCDPGSREPGNSVCFRWWGGLDETVVVCFSSHDLAWVFSSPDYLLPTMFLMCGGNPLKSHKNEAAQYISCSCLVWWEKKRLWPLLLESERSGQCPEIHNCFVWIMPRCFYRFRKLSRTAFTACTYHPPRPLVARIGRPRFSIADVGLSKNCGHLMTST